MPACWKALQPESYQGIDGKIMKTVVVNLQYVNDCAIITHSAEELLTSPYLFVEVHQSIWTYHQHQGDGGHPLSYPRLQNRTSRNQRL